MTTAALIYPHQLFEPHPALLSAQLAVLIEDPLLFSQYRFHRQKLIFHRASMASYAAKLRATGVEVRYVTAKQLANTQDIAAILREWQISTVRYVDPCDDYLARRLARSLTKANIASTVLDDPHFLTPTEVIKQFVAGKSKLFFTEFYIAQRKRLRILLEDDKPQGGRWSFDPDNRKKLPATVKPPSVKFPAESQFVIEARASVRSDFPNALGADEPFRYPIDHSTAAVWLNEFVQQRLLLFGDYEDAISSRHGILYHSLLTPMLNVGLISPQQILDIVLPVAPSVPMNSLEGFIRQIIGWREYVRLVYLAQGRRQRTRNYWGYRRPIPAAFYTGTTGIAPVDHVIKQLLRTGYCHHIERLMILGNFMLLCELDPDAIYQWFMEFFIDAYDWVMVPNVYGMSQFADGGTMTTKPYISGSSYVLKMSDFRRGPWCQIWDALYWRFVDSHRDFFAKNPRTSMIARMCEKLGDKLTEHHRIAAAFLTNLHGAN